MKRSLHLLALAALIALAFLAPLACAGQGAPPFRTEDPETPGNRHLEFNFGAAGNRNPSDGEYELPSLDLAYGLGSRMQLKYELPLVVAETRPTADDPTDGRVIGGLGHSVLGAKLRFYQHTPGNSWIWHGRSEKREGAESPEEEPSFAASIFPRLSLDNPTRSVARGVIERGPNLLLPVEVSARMGPIHLNGEAGYQFGNRDVPQSWVRGLMIGHDFRRGTQAYIEIYDRQDANRIDGLQKRRDATAELGGRQTLGRHKRVLLLLMGGRSFQSVVPERSQPSWIAYVGVRFILGPEEAVSEREEEPGKKED
ncbi:hypothetical protein [Granulicella aggregans]|uniref:hypothetical protein n=1 Tax=Granulicella aggregans TaxID=474949 RepID=UPI0021DFA6D5|nr:hypothetical protein [Granulicella aggregans]